MQLAVARGAVQGAAADIYGSPSVRRRVRDSDSIELSAGEGVERLTGYALLRDVRKLRAPRNLLSSLDGIPSSALRIVYVPDNAITRIGGAATLRALRWVVELDLSGNLLASLDDLLCDLMGLTCLKALWLSRNPCAGEAGVRSRILAALPLLEVLDNVPVALADRCTSAAALRRVPTAVLPLQSAAPWRASSAPRQPGAAAAATRRRTVIDRWWWSASPRTGLDPHFAYGAASSGAPDGAAALGHIAPPQIVFGAGRGVLTSTALALRATARKADATALDVAWDAATCGGDIGGAEWPAAAAHSACSSALTSACAAAAAADDGGAGPAAAAAWTRWHLHCALRAAATAMTGAVAAPTAAATAAAAAELPLDVLHSALLQASLDHGVVPHSAADAGAGDVDYEVGASGLLWRVLHGGGGGGVEPVPVAAASCDGGDAAAGGSSDSTTEHFEQQLLQRAAPESRSLDWRALLAALDSGTYRHSPPLPPAVTHDAAAAAAPVAATSAARGKGRLAAAPAAPQAPLPPTISPSPRSIAVPRVAFRAMTPAELAQRADRHALRAAAATAAAAVDGVRPAEAAALRRDAQEATLTAMRLTAAAASGGAAVRPALRPGTVVHRRRGSVGESVALAPGRDFWAQTALATTSGER